MRFWTFGVILLLYSGAQELRAQERGRPWKRHTIDASSRGADGVRMADVNGDGDPDIVTGWEEGGRVRLVLNPGPSRVIEPWPWVTVGTVASPEDAVLVDLDGDGAHDVVSCCEGNNRRVFVHWAPANRQHILDANGWRTEPLTTVPAGVQWMYCLPTQVDGRRGIDLVLGSKNQGAQVGWLEAPENPRAVSAWRWHPLIEAGWIMSLVSADMDRDGDQDVVVSDRKGRGRGCYWLENPGRSRVSSGPWNKHRIGAEDVEAMFLTLDDLDGDGLLDVIVAAQGAGLVVLRQRPDAWERVSIPLPPRTGTAKAVAVGDVDLDGQRDLVFTCEHAENASGVLWLSPSEGATERNWGAHEISGSEGIKYDLIELRDLDADGDLDAITCEERANLGVVWYENPTRSPSH